MPPIGYLGATTAAVEKTANVANDLMRIIESFEVCLTRRAKFENQNRDDHREDAVRECVQPIRPNWLLVPHRRAPSVR